VGRRALSIKAMTIVSYSAVKLLLQGDFDANNLGQVIIGHYDFSTLKVTFSITAP
jgi:hypothetical protein